MMMSLYRTIKGTKKRRRERSLGPLETFPREMVSRRKILSRSRDDLNLDQTFQQQEEEEDIWYQKDKLYKEHIQEVLDKWTQIDDEIWAKVIVFERNRRVAKAYARAPVLTINGSDDGFDGMRIGLCGFDNPMRDQKTEEMKRHVGQGVKIKMDDAGNILVRRYSKSNVYVKSTASTPNDETAIGAEVLKLPNQALESEKIVKLFDMKKFQSNVNRELRRAYPDRRRLETQCLSAIAFVKGENDVLDCPVWVLIVNVVAMDMLKSKLPPVQRLVDIKNRPRIPIPDEDPYSIAGNGGGSSGSSGFGASGVGNPGHVAATREQLLLQTQQLAQRRSEKPPKLPPRDNLYPHELPKPDYDDMIEDDTRVKSFARGKSDKGKDNKKFDDPYYCGLRARVPNFVKTKTSNKEKDSISSKRMSISHLQHPSSLSSLHQIHQIHPHQQLMAAHQHHQQMMWHARSFESGIGIYEQLNNLLEQLPYYYYTGNSQSVREGYDKPMDEWTDDTTTNNQDRRDIIKKLKHTSSPASSNIGYGVNGSSINNSGYGFYKKKKIVNNQYGYLTKGTQKSTHCNPNYGPCLNRPKSLSESSVFGKQHYEEIDSGEEFSADSIERDYSKNRFQNPIFANFLQNRENPLIKRDDNKEPVYSIDERHIERNTDTYKDKEKYVGNFYVQTNYNYPYNLPRKTSFRTIRKPTDITYEKLPKSVSTESFFLENLENTELLNDRFLKDKSKIDQIYYENAKSKIDEHLDMLVKKEGGTANLQNSLTNNKKLASPVLTRTQSYNKARNIMVNLTKQNKPSTSTLQKLQEARKRLRSSFSGLRSDKTIK